MRWPTVVSGLLSVAAVTEARSWQHVNRKVPTTPPTGNTFVSEFLKTRATTDHQFLNANTTKFAVNGTGIPDVNFDIGESYSGLLSITEDLTAEEKLFFWFFPSTNELADKEIVFWLNGGPGCSSLEGLIQENGPFLWQYGTFEPVPNPWSWHRLTNIVYVEQPVGTGFTTGKVTATSEEDVAKQFMGFWKNFVDTFSLQGYKVYVAGESYAGLYCPYIASAFLDAEDTTYYNMSGLLIYDPVIGDETVETSAVVQPFTEFHKNLLPFNDSYTAYLQQQHQACGFADFTSTYLTYPPPGPQPALNVSDECANLWSSVYSEAFALNPCFDVYQVATTCPLLWDVLGFPGSLFYIPEGANVYFNRTDVQDAIHAPNIEWDECSNKDVFDGGDSSDPSSWKVLPNVIDKTQNVIIGHGILDMILLANGTLLNIQNMTWGGKLGFQTVPIEPFYVPYHSLSTGDTIGQESDPVKLATLAGAGVLGTAHTERGLTFVTVDMSGHMVPQYAPSAAFRHLEFLLGRVSSLSSVQAFGTESNYTQAAVGTLGNGTGAALFDNSNAANATNGTDATKPGAASVKVASKWAAVAAVLAHMVL